MEKSKPFCVAPFIHLYYKGSLAYDRVAPCCESRFEYRPDTKVSYDEAWHSERFREMREHMMRGEPHEACARCIQVEKNGGHDSRAHYQRMLDQWERANGETVEFSVETGNQYDAPIGLDYRGSNLCNLKCRMCHPGSSSQIADEMLDNFEEYKSFDLYASNSQRFNRDEINTWLNDVPTGRLVRAKFLGGEPLLMAEIFDSLDHLAEQPNAENLVVAMTSNGTRFPPQLPNYAEKFEQFVIRISLDGLEDIQEYIRTNSHWPKLLKNLHQFAELGETSEKFRAGFSYVIQAYNFFQLPDIVRFGIEWSQQYPRFKDAYFSPVEQDWLSTSLLSNKHKQPIIDELKTIDHVTARQVLEIITGYDEDREITEHHRKKFSAYTHFQDRLRGTDLLTLDPRFKDYL